MNLQQFMSFPVILAILLSAVFSMIQERVNHRQVYNTGITETRDSISACQRSAAPDEVCKVVVKVIPIKINNTNGGY